MKKLMNNKTLRTNLITYLIVIVGYAVMQLLSSAGYIGSAMKGQLIPICVYIVLAVSLNLVVGISGELSLGHAGFMGVGAFAGIVTAACLQGVVESNFLRLIIALFTGGFVAGIAGIIVGIPVLLRVSLRQQYWPVPLTIRF